MQNPLDTTTTFYMELLNPNPTSSKTREGPKYRISFEVERDIWDAFMDTNTTGMLINAACQVEHRNSDPLPKEVTPKRDPNTHDFINGLTDKERSDLKGGPLSIRSEALVRDMDFLQFAAKHSTDTAPGAVFSDEDAREYIRDFCGIQSRRFLDHDAYAAERFHHLLSDYLRWCNAS